MTGNPHSRNRHREWKSYEKDVTKSDKPQKCSDVICRPAA